MLDVLARLTPNPGHYVYDGPAMPFIVAGAGVLLDMALIIAGVTSMDGGVLVLCTIGALAVCVCVCVCVAGMLGPRLAGDPDEWTSTAEYYETVVTWLNTEYGITVGVDDAAKLSRGGQLAVDYNGGQVRVEFVDAAQGDIVVRDMSGQILAPVTTAD